MAGSHWDDRLRNKDSCGQSLNSRKLFCQDFPQAIVIRPASTLTLIAMGLFARVKLDFLFYYLKITQQENRGSGSAGVRSCSNKR